MTIKVLQALIDGISVVTPPFIDAIQKFKLPPPESFPPIHHIISRYRPSQDEMKIDLSPHPQRKTVFSGFTFHFVDSSSPYTEIIPLAGGQIDLSSIEDSPLVSSPLASHVIVFPSDEAPELSPDTTTIMMKRPLSEATVAWVRRGWLPLAEQELMRALVFDGEMRRLVSCATQRCEKELKEREGSVGLLSDGSVEVISVDESDESVETVSSESVKVVDESINTISNQSMKTISNQSVNSNPPPKPLFPINTASSGEGMQSTKDRQLMKSTPNKPLIQATQDKQPIQSTPHKPINTLLTTLRGLKRPQRTDDGDDVEAFFREVDNGEAAKRVREKERMNNSAQMNSETSESELFLSEELESEHEDKKQNEVAEIRVEETTSGKGKRFKKNAFKKATGFVPLHPYQGSSVS